MPLESLGLNNFEWGNTLNAGIAGSPSRVNMLDDVRTVVPIVQQEPYAFDAQFLLQPEQTEGTVIDKVNPVNVGRKIGDRVQEIIKGQVQSQADEVVKETKASARVAGKYILAAALGLLLIYFGFVILIAPATKAVVKEVV